MPAALAFLSASGPRPLQTHRTRLPAASPLRPLLAPLRRQPARVSNPVAATAAGAAPGPSGEGEVKLENINDQKSPEGDGLKSKVVLAGLILCWYASNIMFNIVNKKLLVAFPLFPTVTLIQFMMGAVAVSTLWLLRVVKFQRASKDDIKAILPLAVAHVLGNIFTNIAIRQMAVSFTHTVKAAEPFFSVIIAKTFLGATFTPYVYASLVPIVIGVTLASANEVSFSWPGFITAIAANLAFQSRNVLSKKFMGAVKLDQVNLFGYISMLATLIMLPITLVVDSASWGPAITAAAAAGYPLPSLLLTLMFCGLYHYGYNQFSFLVLRRVNTVTHAVGNTMKRVVVIISSILVFQNPVSDLNKLGTALAILGVGIYSQVKSIPPKPKKTEAGAGGGA